nr:uncharacterized membrane protein At3g27390 isoform X1 [Tanacetum cinerariifolium]
MEPYSFDIGRKRFRGFHGSVSCGYYILALLFLYISLQRYYTFLYGLWLMRQVWDWLFKSCQVNGKILFRDGLIDVKDIEECIVKGRCKKLAIKLPAWSIMQCLLASAKSESSGLAICKSESSGLLAIPTQRYGVTDVKAAGSATYFVDSNGVKQV